MTALEDSEDFLDVHGLDRENERERDEEGDEKHGEDQTLLTAG
jgi:hypothetical protein